MIKVALFGQKTSTSLTDIIPPFINDLFINYSNSDNGVWVRTIPSGLFAIWKGTIAGK